MTTEVTPEPPPLPGGPQRWPRVRALAVDVTPLRQSRDLRLAMAGTMVSRLGSMATAVAVPYQVWTITRSTVAVGVISFFELVPIVTVSLLGGALADAIDRRRLAMIANVLMAVASAGLIVNAMLPDPLLWPIYVLAVLGASGAGLAWPAMDAIYPRLVPSEQLTAVSALAGLTGSAAGILGPALGGLLLSAGGVLSTYAFDFATFGFALACLALMRPVPPAPDTNAFTLSSVLDGFRFLRGRPVLQSTYLIDTVAMVFGMSSALFPAVAATRFGGSTRALGLLYAAPAVGALLVSAASGWTNRVHRHGLAFALAAAVWGVALVGFGLADQLWLSLMFLAAAGGSDMVSGVFRMTIWNTTVPDSHRGRIGGVTFANVASGPALGDLEAGVLAALISVPFAIVSGGVLCVVGIAVVALLRPEVLAYDGRAPTP